MQNATDSGKQIQIHRTHWLSKQGARYIEDTAQIKQDNYYLVYMDLADFPKHPTLYTADVTEIMEYITLLHDDPIDPAGIRSEAILGIMLREAIWLYDTLYDVSGLLANGYSVSIIKALYKNKYYENAPILSSVGNNILLQEIGRYQLEFFIKRYIRNNPLYDNKHTQLYFSNGVGRTDW